ncbi:hypothetical protein [Rubrivirga sp.]|uniref:hypothetical protein n=1 Tax=Rubrivirga sp. TaxID=1885344 RepID=UPI003B524961
MPTRLTLALLAALLSPLAACGGDDTDFDGDIEETGEPGMMGRVQEMQSAVEKMQESAERAPAEPVNFRVLRELLPTSVAGMDQGEVEGATDGAMGFSISRVEAVYPGDGGAQIDIGVMDYGAIPSMAMMGLGWTMADIDREAGSTYERTVTFGGNRGFRSYDADARSGEFSLVVADRFHVEVTGSGVSDDDLEAAVRAVDLSGLAALRDEGRPDA